MGQQHFEQEYLGIFLNGLERGPQRETDQKCNQNKQKIDLNENFKCALKSRITKHYSA